MKSLKKLNLGCGTDVRDGYINLDFANLPGVNIVHNLNKYPWPFKDNEFDEVIAMSNILGFVDNFLKAMEEIWRISKSGAIISIESPLYPSLNCFSDPYTKKVFTYNSFVYFDPKNKFNYYTKARFVTLGRQIIFSNDKYLKIFNSLPNLFPKLYARFISQILPPISLKVWLKTVK